MLRLLCLFLVIVSVDLSGQQVKFYAATDAKKIVNGSYVEVEFVLENADGGNFYPPDFDGFNVVSGPSRQSSTSIINGKMSKSLKLSYGLQPKAVGRFTIGPASITVKGKTMKTKPIPIEVVKGSDRQVTGDQQVYVEMLITDTTTYVGQQIILDYKLYTTLDVRSIKFLTQQDYDGFYTEALSLRNQNYNREIVNGVEYYTKSISRIALFPQQTGTYTISPATISLGIATSRSGGFFFSNNLVDKRVVAQGTKVLVGSLPPSMPSFTGAVGRYKMDVQSPKRTITTDEAITITMQITGNGDNKTVIPQKWELQDGLIMYDPNIIEDDTFTSENGITHRKIFEYLIVAEKPGKYVITPQFEYFDTDSSRYITLSRNLRAINVLQGTNKEPVVTTDSQEAKKLEIFETTDLQPIQNKRSLGTLPLAILLITLLGAVGFYFYAQKQKQSGKFDADKIRRDRAFDVAQTRLQKAKSLLDQGESKSFYEEIVIAVKTYFSDKFGIPALHINKSELLQNLSTKDLSADQIESLRQVLDKAEMAMYAPVSVTDIQSSYEQVLSIITVLEKA